MTEKRRQAAALSYDNDNQFAPQVTAQGKGYVADKIINEAKHHKVPILEDPSLVEILGQLDMNRAIPPELYQAVAEVFAFIYQVDKQQ